MPRGGKGRGGGGRGGGRGGKFPGVGNVLSVEASGNRSGTSSPSGRVGRGGALALRGSHNAVAFDYSQLGTSRSSNSIGAGPSASIRSDTPLEGPDRTPIVSTGPRMQKRYTKPSRQTYYPTLVPTQGFNPSNRPLEEQGDARYLAGFGAALRSDKATRRFRSGDPAVLRQLFAPVSFVQASGEWKDGKWTGKETGPPEKHQVEGTQERFDGINARKAGAGLGFSAPRTQTTENGEDPVSKPPQLSQTYDDEDDEDLVDRLLQAFPDARDLGQDEEFCVLDSSSFGFGQPDSQKMPFDPTLPASTGIQPPSTDIDRTTVDLTQAETTLVKSDSDDDGSEDEQILISRSSQGRHTSSHAVLQGASDSEEERQLDAIIAAGAQQDKEEPLSGAEQREITSEPFVFDFTGADSSNEASQPVVEPATADAFVLGIPNSTEPRTSEISSAQKSADAAESRADPIYEEVLTESSDEGFVPVTAARRLSNRKNTGRKARNAAKKARRRAKKASLATGWDDENQHVTSSSLANRQPRIGDSDIEWGSDGPPDMETSQVKDPRSRGIDPEVFRLRELSLDHHTDQPRTRAEEMRMLHAALSLSTQEDSSAHPESSGPVSYSSISIKANSRGKGRRGQSRRDREQEAILADYMENALMRKESSEEGSDSDGDREMSKATEMDAMIRFMQGMDPQAGGRQLTLGDIEDEMRMAEEEEWMTESDEEGSDVSGRSAERQFADAERRELGESGSDEGQTGSDVGSDASSSDDERPARDQADEDSDELTSSDEVIMRGDESIEDDENEDEDDSVEGRIFDRNFSWAAEDEEFINKIERFCEANEGVIEGNDRKARNKLFKAIESGSFDDEDLVGLTPAKKKRGKNAKPPWDEDNIWAEQLQNQWQKDRETKAANKRKRAAERQAAAMNPFPNTHKKGTKKMAKKAARAARRAGRSHADDDESDDDFATPALEMATNLRQLNDQIHEFLDMEGHSTMALPPMDKRSRAQVHMLASAYSIISKSRGSGRSRFITLIKTSRSGSLVDTRKVNRILNGHGNGSFGNPGKKSLKSKTKGKGTGGGGGGGGGGGAAMSMPRNLEGADVGWGADRIGADNIGHKLLSMMGWAEGSGVGASQGMAEPIGAKIKTSKGGLGF